MLLVSIGKMLTIPSCTYCTQSNNDWGKLVDRLKERTTPIDHGRQKSQVSCYMENAGMSVQVTGQTLRQIIGHRTFAQSHRNERKLASNDTEFFRGGFEAITMTQCSGMVHSHSYVVRSSVS
jgi:hypothetical protein